VKYALAKTKNVRHFMATLSDLRNRPPGVEGMGVLWGEPGEGKTTVVAYAANHLNGIFIRLNAAMTMTSLLASIAAELGGSPAHRRAQMLAWITRKLMEEDRVIFFDEADYLFRQMEMLDVVRDLYDITGTPIMLIGMEHIARRLQEHGRLARRITQWIRFEGLDMADARILADTVCEVGVADDLLAHLHREAKANIGRMVIGLSRIETLANTSQISTVTREDWADRPLFFDQPKFRRSR